MSENLILEENEMLSNDKRRELAKGHITWNPETLIKVLIKSDSFIERSENLDDEWNMTTDGFTLINKEMERQKYLGKLANRIKDYLSEIEPDLTDEEHVAHVYRFFAFKRFLMNYRKDLIGIGLITVRETHNVIESPLLQAICILPHDTQIFDESGIEDFDFDFDMVVQTANKLKKEDNDKK